MKKRDIITKKSIKNVSTSRFYVYINLDNSSFPVGKFWSDYLYPMDFEEFLLAISEEKLVELIKESYTQMKPMLEATHEKALKLYNEYICIGGMPASILNYIEHDRNIFKFEDDILNMIITAYLADMSKYTENIETIRNMKIYNSMPAQLRKENKKQISA